LGLDPANLEATGPCDEMWTVGPQPVLCTARCVCRCAVLLEDESGAGQQAIAVFDKIWKQTANVLRAINFSFLINKMQLSFATW